MRIDIEDDGVGPIEHVILHGAKTVLQRTMEADEWDLAPGLIAMAQSPIESVDDLPDDAREGLPDELRELLDGGHNGQVMQFVPFNLNPEVWTTGEPAVVLKKLARFAAKHPPDLGLGESDRLIGLLFVSEAWMLKVPHGMDREEAMRAAGNRDLSTHPDRVEIRMVYGVDTAGFQYAISQVRGSAEPETEHVQGPGMQAKERFVGDIPDGLEALLQALTEVKPW